ncbi:mandelate racemase/muconate lactonizing enzyme family protein [Allomesorhizobium alhagi]|uniref:Mandelate racemase/muconate lactonizing protein n=1 Tax=Mesorhizobium alhagi CCNWXJ12-2 TaxID=1107882 RepID=H0I3Y4_9HYPH|nr:mandelate racemase/muconate lactonizing enzyme family protein [Mesorhizobium alhagi]EHK52300.1 mandelate racemase/muconate lactonizing protein [Mesorhizobium alhagi CCNWXJ12-2]
MKIVDIKVTPIVVPLKKTFKGSKYQMSSRATLITRLLTDEGVMGTTYNGDEVHTQNIIARIITDEILPLIQGKDPSRPEAIWELMKPLTFDILRDRRLVIMAMSAVDSACWDVVGKCARLPLSRLWGGYRDSLPIIAIGGYYGLTHAELAAEVEDYIAMGIGGCKMKIGGASPAVDAERFMAMRKAGGEDFILMADANQGYTQAEALEFAARVADGKPRWLEEPVRWDNARNDLRDVRLRTGIPVTAGQSETGRADARDLMAAGAIDVCNFDASWSGGPTEWLRVAGCAASYGVQMAHHEEPQIAAHLLAAFAHGTYLECFHPDRDPIFWNLLASRGECKNGIYVVPTGPGLGIELNEDYVAKYAVNA